MKHVSSSGHVFVSYSRQDLAFVERFVADLTRLGITPWVDRTSLLPGTPSWEQAIRDAIRESSAVILVASPSSRASLSVAGEIRIALNQRRQILPVWANGTEWIDCVPLDVINTQYLDLRESRYEQGLSLLVNSLAGVIAEQVSSELDQGNALGVTVAPEVTSPEVYICLDENQPNAFVPISINPKGSVRTFLDHLWVRYLSTVHTPYTYGKDWVLVSANSGVQRVILPWSWIYLSEPAKGARSTYQQWSIVSCRDAGLISDTYWRIANLKDAPLTLIGLATNNDLLLHYIAALGTRGNIDSIIGAMKMTAILTFLVKELANLLNGAYMDAEGEVKISSPYEEELLADCEYRYLFRVAETYHLDRDDIVIIRTRSTMILPAWL